MSNLAKLRREYFRVLQGQNREYSEEWFQTTLPSEVWKRWKERYYACERPLASDALKQPRLINHFCLGADPEFALVANAGLVDATSCGLKAGLCYGADNNGRLVELRPAPSRFALKVLASMYEELWWMYRLTPDARKLAWKSGAWSGKDGLGGHVHFGRKKGKLNKEEVCALAHITIALRSVGMFDSKEMDSRTHHTTYGQLDDTRPQKHGYEYRALPSYLRSPWEAYLCLVLTKLAVHSPLTIPALGMNVHPTKLKVEEPHIYLMVPKEDASHFIRALLAAYKDLDDDARVAYLALQTFGLVAPTASIDFKQAWGIVPTVAPALPSLGTLNWMLPTDIEPQASTVEKLYNHLVFSHPLTPFEVSEPTWTNYKVPEHAMPLQAFITTKHNPGVGEVISDLLSPAHLGIFEIWSVTNRPEGWVGLSEGLMRLIGVERRAAMAKQFPGMFFTEINTEGPHNLCIRLDKGLLGPELVETTKRLLRSGFLPLCPASDWSTFDVESWKKVPPARKRSVTVMDQLAM